MEDHGPESFAPLTDRLLPAPIAHAAWCPTMDLLAAAFTDGRIAVHRLNWQRLWLVTPDAAATALAWTPSGDALAVGRADGVVSLLDAETGDVVDDTKFESSGWLQCRFAPVHLGAPVVCCHAEASLIHDVQHHKLSTWTSHAPAGAVTALAWVEEEDAKVDSAAVPQLALQGRARRFCPPPPAAVPATSTTQVAVLASSAAHQDRDAYVSKIGKPSGSC
jgi:WD40 repeat protein